MVSLIWQWKSAVRAYDTRVEPQAAVPDIVSEDAGRGEAGHDVR